MQTENEAQFADPSQLLLLLDWAALMSVNEKGQKLVHNVTFRTTVPRDLKNAKSGGVPAPSLVTPGWGASRGIDIIN